MRKPLTPEQKEHRKEYDKQRYYSDIEKTKLKRKRTL